MEIKNMKTCCAVIVGMLIIFTDYVIAQDATKPRIMAQPEFIAIPKRDDETVDAYTFFKGNEYVQQAGAAIQTVLGERGARYKDFELAVQASRKKDMTKPGDNSGKLSMQSGADIALGYKIDVMKNGPLRKVRISINVSEVVTEQAMGDVIGVSDEVATNDVAGLCIAAVNNCIERVLATTKSYWDRVPTEGKPMKVDIYTDTTDLANGQTASGAYYTDLIDDLMKEVTISYKTDESKENQRSMTVFYDINKYEQPADWVRKLRQLLTTMLKPVTPKISPSGALIRVTIP